MLRDERIRSLALRQPGPQASPVLRPGGHGQLAEPVAAGQPGHAAGRIDLAAAAELAEGAAA